MCANNYLGLSSHPEIVKAAHEGLDTRGYGMSSVRFICGTQDIHRQLEEKVTEFLGYTAHAVACFAFGADVPVVDVNVRRYSAGCFGSPLGRRPEAGKRNLDPCRENFTPGRCREMEPGPHGPSARLCAQREIPGALVSDHIAVRFGFFKVVGMKHPMKKRPEPSFKGIPRRIYRGRILKALHEKPLTLLQLGERIVERFHPRDLKWILQVLETMEREALIAIRGNRR